MIGDHLRSEFLHFGICRLRRCYPAQFDFEGTPVWAVLDFALRRPDGGVDLYDWKTGVVDPGRRSSSGRAPAAGEFIGDAVCRVGLRRIGGWG